MTRPIIEIEGLGKRYAIRREATRPRYRSLREELVEGWRGLWRAKAAADVASQAKAEDFWALRDVSFSIQPGDTVGIIGRNGAGKSTLLKILSRITEPTTGRARLRGRVASLLEVGTGFHPELTGRENVFLNGAILGMRRREIAACFDEIVAFAEVDKFIDTPVKRYSSGMYVRLAFAVAAHLQPEILVVDEVLAVGDAEFQRKCLGKMGSVASQGRTVLFVSHNMGAIRTLCNSGVFLKDGQMAAAGPIQNAIAAYLGDRTANANLEYVAARKSTTPHVKRIEVRQPEREDDTLAMDRPFEIEIELDPCGESTLEATILIRNAEGVVILHSTDEFRDSDAALGTCRTCRVPSHALAEGRYFLMVALSRRNVAIFEKLEDVIVFAVRFSGPMSTRTTGSQWKGVCGPGLVSWR